MYDVFYYFLIFFIYSVLGWVMESVYVGIKQKKVINRGFLIGPYCPIYGYGSLVIVLYLMQYKGNVVTVFLLTVFICSFLEYITSYLMEKIFKARWWDYSNERFNLEGRICGKNAILFGLGGLVIVYILHPIISLVLDWISPRWIMILSGIFFVIYITDSIVSFYVIRRLKKNLRNLNERRDSTQEMKDLVYKTINNNISNFKMNLFQRRIIRAFPNIDLEKFVKDGGKQIKKMKEFIKK